MLPVFELLYLVQSSFFIGVERRSHNSFLALHPWWRIWIVSVFWQNKRLIYSNKDKKTLSMTLDDYTYK